jgi:AcrR family transcriptional regulator
VASAVTARHRATTRSRLIEAALDELDDKGVRGARVDSIAARAGLTSGAIYGMFRTKDDLVLAALEARAPGAVARARNATAPISPEVADAALGVLDERGYRDLRLAQVARACGIATDALRLDFPTKHDLIAAAVVASVGESAGRGTGDEEAVSADALDSTRDRLINATLAIADSGGLRAVTATEIARRAGMTTGAIYANFGSKDELVSAALRWRYDQLFRSALDAVGDAERSGGLLGALATTLTTEATIEHRALLEVLAAASRGESARVGLERQLERRHEVVGALIDRAKAKGQMVDEVPTGGLAHIIQLLALGNVVGQAVGLPAPVPGEIEQTLEILGQGLVGDGPAQTFGD